MSRSCKQKSDYHEQIMAHLPTPAAVERYHNTIMKLPEQATSAPGTKDHYLVQLKRLVKDEFRLGDRVDYQHNTCVVPAPSDIPVNDMPYQLITSPAHTAVLDKQPLRANVIRRYNTDNNYYDSDPRSMIISAYDDTYGNSFGDPPLDDIHGQRPGSPGGGGCCCGCGDSRCARPNAEMLFYGWIGQHVGDHDRYPYHVRKVKIVFYSDDGTIEVIEPYEQDGGRKQQVFLSRQLMPKAESPGSNYELKDFVLGTWHTYYSHRIQICDASDATKYTLNAMGFCIGQPVPIPDDKFTAERIAIKYAKTHQTYHVPDHKEFDKRWRSEVLSGIVLRFFAILDERAMPYGLIRKAEIHFFVEDGTIEITEPMQKNDGRNPATSRIIRRTHVPRSGLSAPTEIPQFDMSKIVSELALVTEDDIKVGQSVKLFSRTYFVYDCDGFTRRYYSEKKQIPQPEAVDWEEVMFPNRKLKLAQIKSEREANARRQYADEVNSPGGGILPILEDPPPYNIAKQRRMASATKQLNYGDKKLTFSAQLLNCNTDAAAQTPVSDGTHDYMVPFASPNPPVAGGDRNNSSETVANRRTFVISIGVSSDLVTVFELRRNNSGFKGGTMFGPHKVPKFSKELCLQAQRRAVQQEWRAEPVYLSLADFYVGAVIDVHGYSFRLMACDEPTVEFCSQCSPALWSPEKVQAMRASAEEALANPIKYEHGFFDHYVGARKGEFIRCEDDLDYITDRVVLDMREKALQRRITNWRAYLCYDNARQAYLDAPALKRALQYMNLPSDDDIVREIMRRAKMVYAAEGPEAARKARRRDLNNCLTDYSTLENDSDVKTLQQLRAFEANDSSSKNACPDRIIFEEFNALIENSRGATWRSVMENHPCIDGPVGPREGYLYNTDLPYIHYEPDPAAAGSRFVYKNEAIPGGLF